MMNNGEHSADSTKLTQSIAEEAPRDSAVEENNEPIATIAYSQKNLSENLLALKQAFEIIGVADAVLPLTNETLQALKKETLELTRHFLQYYMHAFSENKKELYIKLLQSNFQYIDTDKRIEKALMHDHVTEYMISKSQRLKSELEKRISFNQVDLSKPFKETLNFNMSLFNIMTYIRNEKEGIVTEINQLISNKTKTVELTQPEQLNDALLKFQTTDNLNLEVPNVFTRASVKVGITPSTTFSLEIDSSFKKINALITFESLPKESNERQTIIALWKFHQTFNEMINYLNTIFDLSALNKRCEDAQNIFLKFDNLPKFETIARTFAYLKNIKPFYTLSWDDFSPFVYSSFFQKLKDSANPAQGVLSQLLNVVPYSNDISTIKISIDQIDLDKNPNITAEDQLIVSQLMNDLSILTQRVMRITLLSDSFKKAYEECREIFQNNIGIQKLPEQVSGGFMRYNSFMTYHQQLLHFSTSLNLKKQCIDFIDEISTLIAVGKFAKNSNDAMFLNDIKSYFTTITTSRTSDYLNLTGIINGFKEKLNHHGITLSDSGQKLSPTLNLVNNIMSKLEQKQFILQTDVKESTAVILEQSYEYDLLKAYREKGLEAFLSKIADIDFEEEFSVIDNPNLLIKKHVILRLKNHVKTPLDKLWNDIARIDPENLALLAKVRSILCFILINIPQNKDSVHDWISPDVQKKMFGYFNRKPDNNFIITYLNEKFNVFSDMMENPSIDEESKYKALLAFANYLISFQNFLSIKVEAKTSLFKRPKESPLFLQEKGYPLLISLFRLYMNNIHHSEDIHEKMRVLHEIIQMMPNKAVSDTIEQLYLDKIETLGTQMTQP
jgi:hypothetical protein